jgi:hypothetical protein
MLTYGDALLVTKPQPPTTPLLHIVNMGESYLDAFPFNYWKTPASNVEEIEGSMAGKSSVTEG